MAGGGDNERVKLPARQRRGRERRGPADQAGCALGVDGCAPRLRGGRVERFSTLYFFSSLFLFFFFFLSSS